MYGRATRALDSPPYLTEVPRHGQRLPISHAKLRFIHSNNAQAPWANNMPRAQMFTSI